MFAPATAIAPATKWEPLIPVWLFTSSGGKHQSKQSQTFSVNCPLVVGILYIFSGGHPHPCLVMYEPETSLAIHQENNEDQSKRQSLSRQGGKRNELS